MNGIQLAAQKEALNQMLSRLNAITVACRTCQHFDGTRCGQFGEAPPADVIEAGCEGWEFDGVPF